MVGKEKQSAIMLFLELYPNMNHLAYITEIIFSSLISVPFEACWLADHYIFFLSSKISPQTTQQCFK